MFFNSQSRCRSYQVILFVVPLRNLAHNLIPTHRRDAGTGALGGDVLCAEELARFNGLADHQ